MRIFLMVTHDEFLVPFLTKALSSDNYKVFSLAGDASNRRYYRVVQDNQSWVLMRWEPYDPNNYPFLSVLNHFAKNGVHVPTVVAQSPQEGLMLLEDLGDLTLERKFWESQSQEASLEFYQMAVDEIVKIHHPATLDKSDCTAFKIEFNTEKFLWEMNYGKDNLLSGVLKFPFGESLNKEITDIFVDISSRLDKEPKRIAHRDYHSRNLMIKLDQMSVIDFQDARLGPIQYDLVSLMRDSYVDMNDSMARTLIDYYLERSKAYLPKDFSREQFDRIYELQSIQRCFKACGSFASFYHLRQDRRYLKYLSGTLRRVMKAINEFPEYKVFADVLIDSGALERKYESL
ncbi:phosphotransferase [Bdellovibrio bacteriovorus]|uniref:aminoglycoside phosphotransferase family protein n=1 Tax=Bdellovibrio bacteriovorus TaxID=959 RepID=UPI001D04E6E3|nr:phosphotransferase [Bdellovibrio bacteriovorus]